MDEFDNRIAKFLNDDSFIKWVNNPDEDTDVYWEEWIQNHPEQEVYLLKAKQLAIGLSEAQMQDETDDLSKDIWLNITSRIESAEEKRNQLHLTRSKRNWYWIAASLTGLLLSASVIMYFFTADRHSPVQESNLTNTFIHDTLSRINQSNSDQTIYLVDGSRITLQPGSSVKYIAFLKKDKREVYLKGNAFFEVAKDAKRPFYVYTDSIVLRVLGTSFNVTTDKNNGDITIVVHTGKVSVFKKSDQGEEDIILTPRQQVLYTSHTQRMIRSEPENIKIPPAAKQEAQTIDFNFEEVQVSKIFSLFEEAYGIIIHYDKEVLSKCIVTSSLNDETFEEKMKIICDAINAEYTIKNNIVSVDGSGCR